VFSPEFVPDAAFAGRGTLEGSCELAGGSCGMFAEDRARCIAAAEGTVVLEPARLGPRLGDTSVLLLRERRPVLERAAEELGWRVCWRTGEVSRDDSGELAVEGEPDTLSERRACCRIVDDAAGPPSDAEAGGWGLFVGWGMEACCDEVFAAGSADSAAPVMERKVDEDESSAWEVMAMDWAWGLGPARPVACW
jgi:hypothetical protein